MKKRAPEVIQEGNVFIAGQDFLGVTKELALPKIAQTMVDQNGALKRKVGSGIYEALEFNIKLEELDAKLYAEFIANNAKAHIPLVVRTSIHKAGKGDFGLSAEIAGECEVIEESAHASGNTREVSIKIWADFYTLSQDGVPMIIYDAKNYIFNVGGIDYLADVKANLSL